MLPKPPMVEIVTSSTPDMIWSMHSWKLPQNWPPKYTSTVISPFVRDST